MKKNAAAPRILLTGFAPFGGEKLNPSWEAVSSLQGRRILGHRIHALELPVEFGEANRMLRLAVRDLKPALVLCIGQAGGRSRISLERVAINVDDARIPDNAKKQPIDLPVVATGPAAYFTTLPIKAILRDLGAAGIPAEISQTAGTFVCNHVFYGLMHAIRKLPGTRGGFVHIPFSPGQATQHPGAPSMPVEMIAKGLELMVRTAIQCEVDVKLGAGTEH